MNELDKLTMSYMSNRQYRTMIESEDNDEGIEYEAEERFYKKRLIILYKNLFKHEDVKNKTMVQFFQKFNSIAIEHLKREDRASIIQKELGNDKLNIDKSVSFDKSLSFDESAIMPDLEKEGQENNKRDVEAFQNINTVKSCTLDNYVIKNTHVNKKPPRPPPQKIKVRLKSKELRNKDVPKKKNIGNKYEESPKPKDNIQDKKT
jgi:hypothetical protein